MPEEAATPPFALELRGLRKSFGRPAVDGLDLAVPAGELFALLGPNGAGKTTTLRMVAGLLRPDAGSISVFGIDALADPVGHQRTQRGRGKLRVAGERNAGQHERRLRLPGRRGQAGWRDWCEQGRRLRGMAVP